MPFSYTDIVRRNREIRDMKKRGLTNNQIADLFGMSVNTIKKIVYRGNDRPAG